MTLSCVSHCSEWRLQGSSCHAAFCTSSFCAVALVCSSRHHCQFWFLKVKGLIYGLCSKSTDMNCVKFIIATKAYSNQCLEVMLNELQKFLKLCALGHQ